MGSRNNVRSWLPAISLAFVLMVASFAAAPSVALAASGDDQGEQGASQDQVAVALAEDDADDDDASATAAELSAIDQLAKDNADAVVDGDTYIITSAVDSSKALDVSCGSDDSGANVQIYESNHTDAQQWTVAYDDDGYATITNVGSQKALDVAGAAVENGTNVQQYDGNGTAAQKWVIVKNDDGTYTIVSGLATYLVLDVAGASSANGTNVQVYSSNKTPAQKWYFTNLTAARADLDSAASDSTRLDGSKIYTIASFIDATYVVDVSGGSAENGANVQLYQYNQTAAQQWTVSYDDAGYATLTNVQSGKVLDVASASTFSGTNVWQYGSNGTAAQKWVISSNGDGSYTLLSAVWPGLVLDLSGATVANGSNIQVYSSNGTVAQKWYFLCANPTVSTDSAVNDLDTESWYVVQSALNTGYVLDIASGSTENAANVQLYESNGTFAQMFRFNKVSDGVYAIENAKSGSVLDVDGGGIVPGTNVQQWGYSTGNNNQLFVVYKNSDGTYSFVNLASGLALDVVGDVAKNGANIAGAIYSVSDKSQRFSLSKCTELIADGTYNIKSELDETKLVTVLNDSTIESAQVVIKSDSSGVGQKWYFKKVSGTDRTYTIQSLASGLFLTVASDGGGAYQAEASDSGQAWLVDILRGAYTFKNITARLVLDVAGAATTDGTNVQVYTSNGTDAQRFAVVATLVLDSGSYVVKSGLDTGMVLDVTGGSTDDCANVQLYERNSTSAQTWKVTHLGDGQYTLVNAGSGKALDVDSAGAIAGTNVQQYSLNGTAAQTWLISWDPDAGCYIVRPQTNTALVLDVADGSIENGANIQIYTANGTAAQQWFFQRLGTSLFYLYLDAGHIVGDSGYDSGAVGCGYTEADLTAELVGLVASILQDNGVAVHSSVDDGITYTQRQAKAQSLGCTTFVSIHFNSYSDSSATGSESYISADYAADGSASLQSIMHTALISGLGLTDRGMKTANFAVLHGGLPAVLLEVGFITNPTDMSTYQSRKEALAQKLAQGIMDYAASSHGSAASDESDYSIMGTSLATVEQMVAYYERAGKTYPSSTYSSKGASTITEFCKILLEEANAEGVRAEVVFCQAMLETGWLQFGGDVSADQCNFCGLGATGNGVAGATFADVQTGLRAQVQHLKAYASTEALVNDTVDPRFGLVTRGSATTVSALAGKWAASVSYGDNINEMIATLLQL